MIGNRTWLTRLARVAVGAAALAAVFAPANAAPDEASGTLYVTAGSVHTGTGEVFAPGAVAVVDGKIRAVGRPEDVAVPAGARVIEGGRFTSVVPGFVAASSEHLAAGGVDPATVAPTVRAIDGYDFLVDEKRVLAGGVTTVLLSPGSQRVVSGRSAIVKTAGASPKARTLRADAGLVAGVGEAVQHPPAQIEPPSLPDATDNPLLPHVDQLPVTRAGSLLLLRELLESGRAGDPVAAELVAGRERIWIGAETIGDIEAALALLAEWKLQGVLVGGREAALTIDGLKAAGVSVVLHWPDTPGRVSAGNDADTERARAAARGNAAALAQAGVPFALSVSDDRALPDLHFVAASAARAGLDPEAALAAITSSAAQILGVADRVGSLAPGLDGDLVLLSGPPADIRSFALSTVVEGEVVWERTAEGGAGGTVVVRAAEIHIGDGTVLTPGEIAFEDGKIVEVGVRVGVPPGAHLVDLGEGTVIPGLIDAFSHAGLAGTSGGVGGDLPTAVTTAQALSTTDPSFALLAAEGVTSVLCVPGGGGRVSGRASVVKTHGDALKERILKNDAGLVVRLRNERDLAAAVEQLDGILKKAKGYKAALEKYAKEKQEYDDWKKKHDAEVAKAAAEAAAAAEKAAAEKKAAEEKAAAGKGGEAKAAEGEKKDGEEKKPEDKKPDDKKTDEKKPEEKKADDKTEPVKPATDEDLAGYADALDGKVPTFVQAGSLPELRAALDLLVKKWKLNVVIVGGEDVRRMAPQLWTAKAGVIASPRVMDDDRGMPVNLLRELALTGLPAAVGSSAYLGGAQLNELLAYAVARGLSPSTAIEMATGDAAQLLGVANRIGTLAPGRDADLVLLTGTPFGRGSTIRAVYVDGKEVQRESR